MCRARIEPDVENVANLCPVFIGTAAEETLTRTFRKPCIGTFCLESFKDALVHGIVLKDIAFLISEDADWHTPCALTRKNPIRATFDHGTKTILTGSRHETRIFNRFQRARTQRGAIAEILVHIDKPLRRVAEDNRLLRAP